MCSDRGRKGDGVAAATGRRAKGDGVVHGLASPPKRGARGILKLGRNMARSVGRRGGGEEGRTFVQVFGRFSLGSTRLNGLSTRS